MHVTPATQHHGCQHHVDKPSCFCFTMLSGSCLILFWWAKLQVCYTFHLSDICERWNLPTELESTSLNYFQCDDHICISTGKTDPQVFLFCCCFHVFSRFRFHFKQVMFSAFPPKNTMRKPIFFRKCAGSAPKEVPRTKAQLWFTLLILQPAPNIRK